MTIWQKNSVSLNIDIQFLSIQSTARIALLCGDARCAFAVFCGRQRFLLHGKPIRLKVE